MFLSVPILNIFEVASEFWKWYFYNIWRWTRQATLRNKIIVSSSLINKCSELWGLGFICYLLLAGMGEIARRVYNLVKNRAESSRDRVEAAQRRSRSSISFEYSSILLDSKAENRVILDFTRKNRKMNCRDDENWLESRFCEIEYFISPRYRFFPRSRSPAPKQLAHRWDNKGSG